MTTLPRVFRDSAFKEAQLALRQGCLDPVRPAHGTAQSADVLRGDIRWLWQPRSGGQWRRRSVLSATDLHRTDDRAARLPLAHGKFSDPHMIGRPVLSHRCDVGKP